MGIKAHYLQDNDGNKFYPYSHIDATYDRNGNRVGLRLDGMDKEIEGKAPLQHKHSSSDVDIIFEYETKDKFPLPGVRRALYIDTTTDETYRWSESEFKYHRMNSIDSIKILNGKTTRIILNASTNDEWEQNALYVPDKGEVCIYTDKNRAKIGDGSTTIGELRFSWLSAEDLEEMTHTHSNEEILNRITAAFTEELENALRILIEKDPEKNVQADWNEIDDNSSSYIKNKPTRVSAFENDKGYITDTELESTKKELEDFSTNKAAKAEQSAKDFATQLIEKMMGNISDETLDTIEEVAAAIKENENILDSLTEIIGLKAEKIYEDIDAHTSNRNIHMSEETVKNIVQNESKQNAYAHIAIHNESLLSSHKPSDTLNFETEDGIEFVVENGKEGSGIDFDVNEGGGEVNRPYDTIKIKNTRPIYRLYSNEVDSNKIELTLEEYFPLTGKSNYYRVPIKANVVGKSYLQQDANGLITIDITDIKGNSGTTDRWKNRRLLSVSVGRNSNGTYIDGTSDIHIGINRVNTADLEQTPGDELILNSAL